MTLILPDLEPSLPRLTSALHGPAHPDEFRVKVGRYGDRWYHDPLPGCDLADATTDSWPSVTTIKKAADRDWSWVSLERAASYLEQRRHELDGLNAAEIHARLNEINKAGLNRAGDRGNQIHAVMEALAVGGTLPNLDDSATPYLPACQRFLNDTRPEWLLSEVVTINRTDGYGGTFDAVLRIDGGTYLVDWKTRKPGKHGAYIEEGWQLAAYAHADYIIADVDGVAARQRMPHLDGAYVISLAPEGYRPYPVDLDRAWAGFKRLRRFWESKQDNPIGKPTRFATKPTSPPTPSDANVEITAAELLPAKPLRSWILGRLNALNEHPAAKQAMRERWPEDMPRLSSGHQHTADELSRLTGILDEIERDFSVPFGAPDPTIDHTPHPEPEPPPLPPLIDEGPTVDPGEVAAVIRQVDQLNPDVRTVLNGWAREANSAGHGFNIKLVPSRRRLEIYRAVLALAGVVDGDDTDLARATVALVHGDAAHLAVPLGHIIGQLTTSQAAQLADIGDVAAKYALVYDNDGTTVHWATNPINPTNEPDKQETNE